MEAIDASCVLGALLVRTPSAPSGLRSAACAGAHHSICLVISACADTWLVLIPTVFLVLSGSSLPFSWCYISACVEIPSGLLVCSCSFAGLRHMRPSLPLSPSHRRRSPLPLLLLLVLRRSQRGCHHPTWCSAWRAPPRMRLMTMCTTCSRHGRRTQTYRPAWMRSRRGLCVGSLQFEAAALPPI
jgi:hypothetical protein